MASGLEIREMQYLRWYDKDPVLKEFMNILEALPKDTVNMVAQDFIQIIMESGLIDADYTISMLDKTSPRQYNRWYDKDYNLHTCIELLKNLDEQKKEFFLILLKNPFFT
ncbi:MAG: hypothetical protein PHV37_03690 [Candidatus Gastranaerophilales bacterium]|nr:hypothetical protein [Candidatus Gastranaerophilales bacterium]